MQMLTGIDQSDYSKIESGKRYYTFEQCKRIAMALNTSMDYLAGLTDEKRPYPRKKVATLWYPKRWRFSFSETILNGCRPCTA